MGSEKKSSDLTKEFSSNFTVDNCYDLDTAFWMPRTKFLCGDDYLNSEFSNLKPLFVVLVVR